jgi:hypothetical protein
MKYAALIDQFEQGGAKVKAAIAGLSREELLAAPVPGRWSTQQVVIHLQDSDAVAIDRMRRIAAEELPLIIAYDENLFVQNLFYDEQSAADAAELIDLGRRQWARALRKLPEAAFERAGIHSARGRVTLADQLEMYTKHLERHLEFVAEKRKALGK